MNAHALLTSQGWRGTGHSLHPTSDTTGLSKPLLVSKKANNLGIGKKQHNTSDMWWLNAFDKSLQGLDTSKEGVVVQTVTNGGLDMVVKGGGRFVGNGGGLYASFVRGEVLGGTLTPKEKVENIQTPEKKSRKEEGRAETKEERRARKAAKRAKRAEEAAAAAAEEVQTEDDTEVVARTEIKGERTERRRQKKIQEAERHEHEDLSEKAKKKKRRKE